ncbi:MAG: hypothetical protein Q9195_003956 [Heterodermia aff. obscurata]
MVRSQHSRASSLAPGAARHKASLQQRKPSYKVVLEEVTEKKKKLLTQLWFNTTAPRGYTFIPAGDPQLTNRCKEFARKDGSDVKKSKKKGSVLQQTFPPIEASQAEIDTEASQAIRDLFPKIPEENLLAVVQLAFKKGNNLVGTADLPLHRRAQLGVLAHIRHVYTNYEQLLRTGEWKDARAAVELQCLDKLVQWRGDDENDTDAMSDILREVIVIPDDEDEYDSNLEMDKGVINTDRETSVEVIATQAAAKAVQIQQIHIQSSPDEDSDVGQDSDEVDVGTYKAQSTHDPRLFDRVEAHRHRVWAAARNRRHNGSQNIHFNSSPKTNNLVSGRPVSYPVQSGRYAEYETESHINCQGFRDTRIPFSSAMQRVQSPPLKRRATPIIDIKIGTPYSSSSMYPQHKSRSIPSSQRPDDLHGRSQALNNSHRLRDTMEPNPKGNVTLASDNAYRVQSAGREFSPEQILPSIEQPCQVIEARNPFRQRSGEAPQSVSREGDHGDWKSPVAQALASSDLDTGRKRRFEVEEALPSPYNQSNVTTGTMLIPLEEYNERYGKEARFYDSEHHHNHVAYGAPEQRGYHHLTAETEWHDPRGAVKYSDRIEDPPKLVEAPAGRYQRPPHLQIQLKRGASGVRSASPICLKSTISNSSVFPISEDDQSRMHGAPNHASLTRSNHNSSENGYVQRASALNTLRDVPAAVRDLPRQLETQVTASYPHGSGHPRYPDDPWAERNDPNRAYIEPRPASRGGMDNASQSMRENQESYQTHSQFLVEPGAIIRDAHHHTELPLRTRQTDDRAHISDFHPDALYGGSSSPSGFRHQNMLRYVASSSTLNSCRDFE